MRLKEEIMQEHIFFLIPRSCLKCPQLLVNLLCFCVLNNKMGSVIFNYKKISIIP